MTKPSILHGSLLAASLALAPFAPGAHAGGTHGGSHGQGGKAAVGEPGMLDRVSRTIEVTMYDNFYEPESIRVKTGETVRILVRNEGHLVHEFNINTSEMHAAHQEEMRMMLQRGAAPILDGSRRHVWRWLS